MLDKSRSEPNCGTIGISTRRSSDEASANHLGNASFIGGKEVPGAEEEFLEVVPSPFPLDDGWSVRF